MSESQRLDNTQSNLAEQLDVNGLDDQQVADYLRANPDFFAQFPGVLQGLRLPHQQKGSVSLVERQAEQMRERVKVLQSQIADLVDIAKQNERIYRVYADLNLRLYGCKSISDVERALDDVLLNQLDLTEVSIRLFGFDNDLPETSKRHLLKKRFSDKIFYLGRLNHSETQMVFTTPGVQSVAMMLIGERGEMGILAVGSKEPHHFHPGMDTLLFTQLQKFLTLIIPQLAEY